MLLILRSLGALKKQLLPAIQPLADTLPSAPQSDADIRLFEDKPITDGSQEKAGGLRSLEDEQKTRSLTALGWDRWKKVYVRYAHQEVCILLPAHTQLSRLQRRLCRPRIHGAKQ